MADFVSDVTADSISSVFHSIRLSAATQTFVFYLFDESQIKTLPYHKLFNVIVNSAAPLDYNVDLQHDIMSSNNKQPQKALSKRKLER